MIVREFLVRKGCENDFELVFGPSGVWSELLRSRSEGYGKTEVKVLSPEEGRCEVRDYWQSHFSFEAFRESYQLDVEKFHDWLASKEMILQEKYIGAFYLDEGDGGDDAGLVQA